MYPRYVYGSYSFACHRCLPLELEWNDCVLSITFTSVPTDNVINLHLIQCVMHDGECLITMLTNCRVHDDTGLVEWLEAGDNAVEHVRGAQLLLQFL
jgi:hypothetical protein